MKANVLIDEGAQRSFITTTCAEQLKLKAEHKELINLAPFGAKSNGIRSMENAKVTLETNTGSNITIQVLMVPKISTPLKSHINKSVLDLPHLQGLTLVNHADTEVVEIDILIGSDYYWSIIGDDIIRGPGPTAVSSKFGYLLSGPTHPRAHDPSAHVTQTTILHVMTDSRMEDKLTSRYWDLETIGVRDVSSGTSTTDEFEKYRDSHLSKEKGKYTASLPWLDNHPPLPTNYGICNVRTRSMIRRLSPELRAKYNNIINDQVSRGFISEVVNDDTSRGHYLPHRAVKKDSETTQ
ncbi:uncharacterized protein [Ptychodera flava]|uniref:uncharacterized protein n=1 Tax=Ptychodera flava TaxID=63121 RepID=UPI00396A7177